MNACLTRFIFRTVWNQITFQKVLNFFWECTINRVKRPLGSGFEPESSASCMDKEVNFLKPTGYVMHQQFNIQQLYALPTLYLCVLYLSENKQRLVPLTS